MAARLVEGLRDTPVGGGSVNLLALAGLVRVRRRRSGKVALSNSAPLVERLLATAQAEVERRAAALRVKAVSDPAVS